MDTKTLWCKLFKTYEDREHFLDTEIVESYRLFDYDIEEDYIWIDYSFID